MRTAGVRPVSSAGQAHRRSDFPSLRAFAPRHHCPIHSGGGTLRSGCNASQARCQSAGLSALGARTLVALSYWSNLGDLYAESGQSLQGSFSAVSKPNFANKYSLESSRRDLHNALLCTALESIGEKWGKKGLAKTTPKRRKMRKREANKQRAASHLELQ